MFLVLVDLKLLTLLPAPAMHVRRESFPIPRLVEVVLHAQQTRSLFRVVHVTATGADLAQSSTQVPALANHAMLGSFRMIFKDAHLAFLEACPAQGPASVRSAHVDFNPHLPFYQVKANVWRAIPAHILLMEQFVHNAQWDQLQRNLVHANATHVVQERNILTQALVQIVQWVNFPMMMGTVNSALPAPSQQVQALHHVKLVPAATK